MSKVILSRFMINDEQLDEILGSLDNSAKNLAMLHAHEYTDWLSMKNYLDKQYEDRLENLLVEKGTSIHHLESGMKNRVIVRKHQIFSEIEKDYLKN